VKAKFIGRDSNGFKHGVTYDIHSELKETKIGGKIFNKHLLCICIYDKDSNAWCPYQSLEAVLKNWMFNI